MVLEAQVGAARACEELGARHEGGLPVEHDRVVTRADEDLGTSAGACLEERLLDAEACEPVCEVADGLVVVEVGLAHPAHGLGTRDAEVLLAVLLDARHAEAGVVDGLRAQHDACGLRSRRLAARLLDELGERERELLEALVAHRGDLEDTQAASFELGGDEVGELARLGDVDLVEHDEAGTLGERDARAVDVEVRRVRGQLGLDDVEV